MNNCLPEDPTGQKYSHRLGIITPRQFQSALAHFRLGDFIDAAPVSGGLFGQNVFIYSTSGQYVLRGCPHYPWQFPKECFGATLLHLHTQVPLPYPYLYDPSSDIFGWPYIIMPRLRGVSPRDQELPSTDQLEVAQALGQNLAHMHELTWPSAGQYDLASATIQPFPAGYAQWIVGDVRRLLSMAREHGASTSADDVTWSEEIIQAAHSALTVDFRPCFVMNDYNPGNILVDRLKGEWLVTGVFDLMEYYFGNGEADLPRMVATLMDMTINQDQRLAQAFGITYLNIRKPPPGFVERYSLFMLRDRLLIWEYGTRPGFDGFPKHPSFRNYAERYILSYRLFEYI